jgi:hypothetical protein
MARAAVKVFDPAPRLSLEVDYHPGEWLPSLLHRVAHALGETQATLGRWCQLDQVPAHQRNKLGTTLVPQAQASIAGALGWAPQLLESSTMAAFVSAAFERRGDVPAQSKLWTRGAGTRYCPECLRDDPGVFQTHWRLWWSFACLKHNIVLRDACGRCGALVVESRIMGAHRTDPNVCRGAGLIGEDHCGQPWAETWDEEPLSTDSLILQAQADITSRWSRPTIHESGTMTAAEDERESERIYFGNLRALGIALLHLHDTDEIATLAAVPAFLLHGLFEDVQRIGTTPPKDALAMGVLMAAVHYLQTADEHTTGPLLRKITFSRPVPESTEVFGPGSASHLQSHFPGIAGRMQSVLLRAIDQDLSPIQRLVWGTPVRAEVELAARRAAGQEEAMVDIGGTLLPRTHLVRPLDNDDFDTHWAPLLPTNWANPLGIDPRTDATTLQRSFGDAVKIAGAARRGMGPERAAFISTIGKRLRPNMLGTEQQTEAILQQVTELALHLRLYPSPINYGHRRRLPWWSLLPDRDWTDLAESVGEDPGRGPKALRVRRFMFLRATATGPRDLPGPWRLDPARPEAAEYSRFLTTMTTEFLRAIDNYLAAWLARRGDWAKLPGNHSTPSAMGAPVAWQPRRWHYSEAELGPELDDINIDLVHEMVNAGRYSLTDLGRQVDRTPRHVRWALMAWPVPSSTPKVQLDWDTRIGPVLATEDMTWQATGPRFDSYLPAARELGAPEPRADEPWSDFVQG